MSAAFDLASDYDRHAAIQRRVATRLAEHILATPLPPSPRVLEVGCGTGFLGEGLVDRLGHREYLMTDIAPAMIERARQRFGRRRHLAFAVLDAATPDLDGPFDLICSSLAMQWVADLPAAVGRLRHLLSPGGKLAFTTLAAGSFAEWRAAYGTEQPGTPDYPPAERLASLGLDVRIDTLWERHDSAKLFLRSLKAIGAGTPQPGYRPLPVANLRRVMRRFEQGGAVARYVVATCTGGAKEEGT